VSTPKGDMNISGTVKPDGSFTYSATGVEPGIGSATGSGKFTGNKFTATQNTACGPMTATGGHIGY